VLPSIGGDGADNGGKSACYHDAPVETGPPPLRSPEFTSPVAIKVTQVCCPTDSETPTQNAALSCQSAAARPPLHRFLLPVTNRQPLGDRRPIENPDAWENVARNLSRQPEKESALTFLRRAQQVRRGAARGLQRGLHPGEARSARGEEETTLHRAFARQRLARYVHHFAERMQSATAWRATAFGRFSSLAPAVRTSAIARFERMLPAFKTIAERAGLNDREGEHQGRRMHPGRRAR
jgi:hypothetical protein